MSDPDLLIRTAGEMRISNFLLWQISYAELWVTPTLWPDFRGDDLLAGLPGIRGAGTQVRRPARGRGRRTADERVSPKCRSDGRSSPISRDDPGSVHAGNDGIACRLIDPRRTSGDPSNMLATRVFFRPVDGRRVAARLLWLDEWFAPWFPLLVPAGRSRPWSPRAIELIGLLAATSCGPPRIR